MMMMKRYLVVAGLLAGIVCLGALVPALLPDRPGVTKANFNRIECGMTRAEVEAILGRAANMRSEEEPFGVQNGAADIWRNPDGSGAEIEFGDSDTVVNKDWGDSPNTIIEKLRRWFHI